MPYVTAKDIRREAAIKAFWSDDPLNLAMRKQRQEFTLAEFIAFVVLMPADEFFACVASSGALR